MKSFEEAKAKPEEAKAKPKEEEELSGVNLCLSCSHINRQDARFCGFCGANLVIGRGKNIIDVLKRSISRRLIEEGEVEENRKEVETIRAGLPSQIPSQFTVELYDGNMTMTYVSKHTYRDHFAEKKVIGIEAPKHGDKYMALEKGARLRLQVAKHSITEAFDSAVEWVDPIKGMLFVRYDEDAMAMHSQKNFSIAPKTPVPISIIVPSVDSAGKISIGKILELSRIRLAVFSEDNIRENECLAITFALPEWGTISTPLSIAQKRKERFMYDVDFVVIDEKERSRMIQYMYKRQIEMAKMESV